MASNKEKPTMDANVTVRMMRDLYDRLAAVAAADRRRVGEMARIIIEDGLPKFEQRLRDRETTDD